MFAEKYGREPLDERELSGFIARMMRPLKQATAGFDLTFTPVKSVSALWAVAPLEVARVIEQCHDQAVKDSLGWIEREALFTRRGQRGVRQVETRGMITAMFGHRDSRAGDPNLHTHVAVSNKVQAADGTWLAIDGRLLYQTNVPASERYNSRIEALLGERLGVRFAGRERGDGKRPVREIMGVDEHLITMWSARRQMIEDESARLAQLFLRQHGRVPTPTEAIALAQEANLRTRADKHEPRSLAEQRQQWWGEATATLGGQQGLQAMLNSVLGQPQPAARLVEPQVVEAIPGQVLQCLAQTRATWRRTHVISEVERQVRTWDLAPQVQEQMVNRLVEAVIHHPDSVALKAEDGVEEPVALRRSSGESMYRVHFSETFTSTAVLRAEREILELAGRTDGMSISEDLVELALLESAANGLELNLGQTEMVRQLARSNRQVGLVLAPAGAGKTAALATLNRAWADAGGSVIGLAPSAAAAAVLGEDLDSPTDTLAHFIAELPTNKVVNCSTMLLIDEAGMAATTDLHQVISWAVNRGATVRLVGDDRQLASVAAGGVLKDLERVYGSIQLREVMRFADPLEAHATLALRDGDVQALGWYVDHSRVHVGRVGSQEQQAFQAWSVDVLAGKTALMLAATKDSVRQLNDMAQAWRHSRGELGGESLTLPSGVQLHVGDVVITRLNNRRIPVGDGRSWVRNGDVWTVEHITEIGQLHVRHQRSGLAATLPEQYVREQVELGYASTIHSAQGRTVDTAHVVIRGEEERRGLYVAATRGREANHLYVGVSVSDEDAAILPEAIMQTTAVEVLQQVLERDAPQVSAHTHLNEHTQAQFRLGRSAGRYQDAVLAAAQDITPPGLLAQINAAAEDAQAGVTSQAGWDTVQALVAVGALSGLDGPTMICTIIGERELLSAESVTGVLAWRAENYLQDHGVDAGSGAPLPWLVAIPAPLAAHPTWGPYLQRRYQLVTDDAADYQREFTAGSAPFWARHIADDPGLTVQVGLWRASNQIPEKHTEPMGGSQPGGQANNPTSRLHTQVEHHMRERLERRKDWKQWFQDHHLQVLEDPTWTLLADQLIDNPADDTHLRHVITSTVADQPLPDETAARALSWRLLQHTMTTSTQPNTLDTAALLANIQAQQQEQNKQNKHDHPTPAATPGQQIS